MATYKYDDLVGVCHHSLFVFLVSELFKKATRKERGGLRAFCLVSLFCGRGNIEKPSPLPPPAVDTCSVGIKWETSRFSQEVKV
jgi:hypothetical protein